MPAKVRRRGYLSAVFDEVCHSHTVEVVVV